MLYSILDLVDRNYITTPDKAVCSDETSSMTYRQLHDASESIGAFLAQELQVTHRPIVVFMGKCPECLAGFFGAIESGNFYVCIDDKMAVERVRNIFDTLQPVAVIKKEAAEFPFEPACPVYDYETIAQKRADEADAKRLQTIRSQMIDTDPAYVLFTSGSTGIPKGSVIAHKSVLAYATWVTETFHLDGDTIFGSQTPFYFSMSVLDIYACLMCGGTIEIIPKKYFSFPIKLLEYIAERQVNTIYWVPSAMSIVANWKALDYVQVPTLRNILFAGEVMPTKQLNVWRRHMPDALYANLFGPTEITDIALYYVLDREFTDDEPIPIGRHCHNMDAFAIDENGKRITGPGEMGELYFRGSFVGAGYYNAWDKTETAFVQNPLNKSYPELVYKTGDLVRLNERGEYVYAGRKDFQIKHMGYRIELGEIEAAASSHEAIESCVCLYATASDSIYLIYQGRVTEEELRTYIDSYLPTYMKPNQYRKLKSMPYNANGKIDRQLLMREYVK